MTIWNKTVMIFRPLSHYFGEILKLGFQSENVLDVTRPHYAYTIITGHLEVMIEENSGRE